MTRQQKNETEPNPATMRPIAVPNDPPEIVEALKLSEAIAAFAAESATRTKLDEADPKTLVEILTIANGDASPFRSATYDQSTRLQQEAVNITKAVRDFYTLNTDKQKTSVGSMVFEIPTLESAFLREQIVKLAAELRASIADFVSKRRAEISAEQKRLREADAQLVEAFKIDYVREALTLYESGIRITTEEPSWDVARGIAEGAERAIQCAIAVAVTKKFIPADAFTRYDLCETIKRQIRAKVTTAERKSAAA